MFFRINHEVSGWWYWKHEAADWDQVFWAESDFTDISISLYRQGYIIMSPCFELGTLNSLLI